MVNQLPQGWKEDVLGNKEKFEYISGVSYKPSDASENLQENRTLLLRSNNIDNGRLNLNKVVYVSNKKIQNKQYLKKNDILIATSSGSKNLVGKSVLILDDSPKTFGAFCGVIRCKNFCAKYVSYYFQSEFYKKYIYNISKGVNIHNLKSSDLMKLSIPYPTDRDEQDYIVKTLDAVAEMIKLRKETIQLTKDLIPAIFQEMFGDPITNPKGWEMKTFREVLTIKNGKSQKDVENANGIYPIYGSAGEIMGYANDFICNENSVIIGRKGNINSPKLIKTKFWNVDTAFGLEPNKGLNYNYLYVFCLLYDFERHNRAVVIPSLVKSDLLEIKIPFPVLSMQEEFSDRIEQINQNLEIQQKDMDRLQELFDQLLQKAFTGELTRGEAYGII